MLPLLYKDGLTLAYISMNLIFYLIIHCYYCLNRQKHQINYWPSLDLSFSSLITISSDINEKIKKNSENILKITVCFLFFFYVISNIEIITKCFR